MRALTWPERLVEAGALSLLVFTPLAFGTVQPWSEAVTQLVILGMLLAWVIGNLGNWELRVALPPGWLPALLFLVLVTLQAAVPGWSADPHTSQRYALKLTATAALFLVCYNTYRTPAQTRRAIWTMMAMGTLVSVLGIVQRMTWTGRLYWIGPEAPGNHLYTFGPFVNRAHFAGIVVIIVPMALALMLSRRGERGRRSPARTWGDRLRQWNSSESGPGALIPFCLVVMGAAALVSSSRGGVLSLIAALLAMLALGGAARGRRRRAAVVALVTLLIVVAGFAIAGDILSGTLERLVEEMERPDQSFRLAVWPDALALWRAAPVMGSGLGSFEVAFPRFRTLEAPVTVSHAESDWIQLATDTGAVGLLLAIAAVGACARALLAAWRRQGAAGRGTLALGGLVSLLGAAVQGVANFDLFVTSIFVYLALALALACGSARHEATA